MTGEELIGVAARGSVFGISCSQLVITAYFRISGRDCRFLLLPLPYKLTIDYA
jgi:hypothetical protein